MTISEAGQGVGDAEEGGGNGGMGGLPVGGRLLGRAGGGEEVGP